MMKSCLEATRLMSEAEERPLQLPERLSLAFHTAICSGCRNFGRQMPLLREAMRRYAARGDDRAASDATADGEPGDRS